MPLHSSLDYDEDDTGSGVGNEQLSSAARLVASKSEELNCQQQLLRDESGLSLQQVRHRVADAGAEGGEELEEAEAEMAEDEREPASAAVAAVADGALPPSGASGRLYARGPAAAAALKRRRVLVAFRTVCDRGTCMAGAGQVGLVD